ncbi:MAG: hypothetical protein HY674_14655 [Chloroflexi bacterium]|nr:hypothetical protein [Chloroflexota bacterium]
MKTTSLDAARTFESPAPVKSSTAICVVYDDDMAKLRARSALPHLLGELGSVREISFSWWRAKFFCHPRALRMASDAIAHAQVILFSWHTGHTLPLVIANWLDEALARRENDEPILVALLESGSADSRRPSLAAACLRRSARKAGVDFLCNAEPVLAGQSTFDFPIIPGQEVLIGN